MEKEFVPHANSLELQKLGFDEDCFGYWNIDPYLSKPTFNLVKPFAHEWCLPAPTFSQAFRWFREKHGIHSWVRMELGYTLTFCWVISGENTSTQHKAFFKSHEEAELACLIKLIEIVS